MQREGSTSRARTGLKGHVHEDIRVRCSFVLYRLAQGESTGRTGVDIGGADQVLKDRILHLELLDVLQGDPGHRIFLKSLILGCSELGPNNIYFGNVRQADQVA